MIQPATAADKPTTEPTETSNSPAIMTIVIPAATISIIVICPSRLPTLTGERKRSLAICITTIRISKDAERLDEAVGALEASENA